MIGSACTPVFGPPGTGKTHTLLGIIDRLLADGLAPAALAFFTFTKNAQQEALDRISRRFNLDPSSSLPWVRTIHSAAFYLSGGEPMGKKHWDEFCELYGYDLSHDSRSEDDPSAPPSRSGDDDLRSAHEYLRARLLPINDPGKYPGSVPAPQYNLYVQRITDFKRSHGLVDFTDMLESALRRQLRPPVDVVIIDEAQDLSPLQQALVTMWSVGLPVYTAGDDDQCQPAGTMVSTPTGPRPIESLVDGDLVVSWDQSGQEIRSRGRSVRVASRPFTGDLIKISSPAGSTETTPNHRFVARWATRSRAIHVVYLMFRPDLGYRVGWCQLFNVEGALHLGARANLERATKTWILHVTTSRQDASVTESIVSLRWSVPTATFQPLRGSTIYTAEALARIFAAVPPSNGERCLRDHALDPSLPLWPPPGLKSPRVTGRRTLFQVHAANLRPGIFSIPDSSGEWVPITAASRRPFSGPVFSMDVDKFHTYVADGLVTHNSIFAFQGANPQWLLDIYASHLKTAILLDQSYRVPRAPHALAERLISRNKQRVPKAYRPRDADGSVAFLSERQTLLELNTLSMPETIWDDAKQRSRPLTAFLLARNWSTLQAWQRKLEDQGIVYTIGHGSPMASAGRCRAVACAQEILASASCASADLLTLLEFGCPVSTAATPTLLPRGIKAKLKTMKSRVYPATFTSLGLTPWLAELRRLGPTEMLLKEKRTVIDYLARAIKRYGGAIPKHPNLHLSTIHSVKGQEADTVVLLSDMATASFDEFQDGQKGFEAENRVAYVGVTRTRDRLIIVDPSQPRTAYPYRSLMR